MTRRLPYLLLVTLLCAQGCYRIGSVDYPTYNEHQPPAVPAVIIQGAASATTVDGKDVTPSVWNNLYRNLTAILTLGKIENQVLATPGKHTLTVSYKTSTETTGYYSKTTTTYFMSGIMQCELKAGQVYEFISDWNQGSIGLQAKSSDKPICYAHRQ